jgi:hypothetical protein
MQPYFNPFRRKMSMEDDLDSVANGRQPQKQIMKTKTIRIKTMVEAPLRVTYGCPVEKFTSFLVFFAVFWYIQFHIMDILMN